MNAKLLIEGKEFDIEILNPELQELLVSYKKKTGYERVSEGENYYYAEDGGGASYSRENWDEECAEECYSGANYYSDQSVAANNSRADKLMRQLRRFAVEHRTKKLDLSDYSCTPFEIWYNYMRKKLEIEEIEECKSIGAILFDSKETAQLVIDTFHDELLWYFTEYKDSL